MFFKSMEIYGFKSFPDKTIINFDTKMTAVVGSNGNGKSNISDALRWVMGEQGAKSLRGDKMEDVIFHGTLRRKPMGFAKVALTIDNRDRTLKVDSDEITVARKLYRSGESEYLINGAKVLLKNIHELFMGTGLGRDGYSVIGQGRVSEIVDSAGSKRREIFEEAAGVSKFLSQKKDAEHKLARTEDNLLRLRDIASELESRIPVLEKQAAKAKKARELLDTQEKLDITVSVYELAQLEKSVTDIENKILLNKAQCENFDRDIERLVAEEEQKNNRRLELRAELEKLQGEGEKSRERLSEIRSEIAVLENDILHANERIEETKQQIEDGKKGGKKLETEKKEIEKSITAKKKDLEDNEKKRTALSDKLESLSSENSTLGKDYDELDGRLGKLYLERTRLGINAEKAQQDIEAIIKRGEELKTNAEGATAKYDEQKAVLKNVSKELEEAENEKQEAENKLVGYRQLYKTRSAKLDEAQRQAELTRKELETKQSRYDVLDGIDKSMAGFASSIRFVMSASKKGALSGVCGTVADLITVPGKYTVAIETALGAVLQNIVVKDENAAKRCIRYLKDNNAGRATFLPLTSVKGRELEADGLSDEEGFLGIASELVGYDDIYDGIMKNILGRTAVAEDIDAASFIARKYGYKFRIVTLDGQIVNAGGSFTGGSVKADAGIISRKQELTEISGDLKKLKEKLEKQEEALKPLTAEFSKMKLEMEGFEETAAACEPKIARLEAQRDGIKTLMAQLRDIIDDNGDAADRTEAEINAAQKQKDSLEKELEKIVSEIEKAEKELEKFKDKLDQADKSKSKTASELADLDIEKVNIERDIEALEARTAAVDEAVKELESGGSEQLERIKEYEKDIAELREQIQQKEAECEKISSSFGESEKRIGANISESNAIESRISEINKDIREFSEEREKFSAELARQEERRSSSEELTEKIVSSLWDKYEITKSEAKQRADSDVDIVEAKSELMTVKRSLAALGNVNYSSIEELDEVSTRYAELSKQLNDVEISKRDLEKLISDLTADIKRMFTESFNEISGHFGRLFSEIFDGGEARLELSDPDDVLNSDVEIYAAPPGKVIKSLTSLSGGEKSMVALTIYLAILLHRPTPFCMLDEVDAALDEANVIKYATYLKRFSNRTQLMVITHRRGTIELCDVLYGVYMQEKGVSGLLKQEITDDLDLELE